MTKPVDQIGVGVVRDEREPDPTHIWNMVWWPWRARRSQRPEHAGDDGDTIHDQTKRQNREVSEVWQEHDFGHDQGDRQVSRPIAARAAKAGIMTAFTATMTHSAALSKGSRTWSGLTFNAVPRDDTSARAIVT